MLTVETDPVAVEQRLGSGRLACPGCSGVLAGWGHARGRSVRDADAALWIVPRGAVHRLPGHARAASGDVAGPAGGYRRGDRGGVDCEGDWCRAPADRRGVGPASGTVRGWLRRFASRVEAVRAVFTGWCRDLLSDPVLPGPAGSAWADAIAVVGAVAAAVGARFCIGEVPVWQAASAVTEARLLLPGWPVAASRS